MPFRSDPSYMADQYEALRTQALGTHSASHRGHGLVLFLARGMAGWLAALAVLAPSAECPCNPNEGRSLDCRMNLPSSIQSDFTSVLADMVLALHPETWKDPRTSMRDRKRMLRLLIDDVTLARDEELIHVHIRWKGGATTSLELPRPRSSFELIRTPFSVINEIRALATEQTDDQIACTLNSRGYRSGTGRSFTRHRIAYVRSCYGIESYHQHLHRSGWLTLPEIAREIGVHPHTASGRTQKKGFCVSFEPMPSISCLNH
jgi:hypothetical protein